MKAFYVYEGIPSYRTEFYSHLSQSLLKENIELTVLSSEVKSDKVIKQDDSNTFKKVLFKSNKFLRFFKITDGILDYIKDNDPDIVVISYITTNVTFFNIIQYCKRKNIPYITWRCGYEKNDRNNVSKIIRSSIIKYVERNARKNITYGSFYKDILIEKGISPDQIVIAQNTINIEKIIENTPSIAREYAGRTKILFVGAVIPPKLLQTSILAIKKLSEEGYDLEFNIVGGGKILDELRRFIDEQNLTDIVFVRGPQYGEDVKSYFLSSHVFLLAGIGGLAINEAMAYGLPIISTNADWTVVDLIDKNGFYMEEYGNVDLQYKLLKRFIELPENEKQQMGYMSRKIILEKASISNMVEQHRNAIYSTITQERK